MLGVNGNVHLLVVSYKYNFSFFFHRYYKKWEFLAAFTLFAVIFLFSRNWFAISQSYIVL